MLAACGAGALVRTGDAELLAGAVCCALSLLSADTRPAFPAGCKHTIRHWRAKIAQGCASLSRNPDSMQCSMACALSRRISHLWWPIEDGVH